MINSQNEISTKNNINKINDSTSKQSSIKREKMKLIVNSSKISSMKQTNSNEKSFNNILERNVPDDNFKLNKKASDEIEMDKKSLNIDDKIINKNPSQSYVCLMRLFYSRNCVNLYLALIAISVIVFIYSLIAYFNNWGKIIFSLIDEYPIIIAEIILIGIFLLDMVVRIYIKVKII